VACGNGRDDPQRAVVSAHQFRGQSRRGVKGSLLPRGDPQTAYARIFFWDEKLPQAPYLYQWSSKRTRAGAVRPAFFFLFFDGNFELIDTEFRRPTSIRISKLEDAQGRTATTCFRASRAQYAATTKRHPRPAAKSVPQKLVAGAGREGPLLKARGGGPRAGAARRARVYRHRVRGGRAVCLPKRTNFGRCSVVAGAQGRDF